MAVDYAGYIDRVQQNARAQQPDIPTALTQAFKMRREGEEQDRRARLSDMEMKRQQMEMDRLARKEALGQRARQAFQNAQPRTLSSLNPAYVSPEKFMEQATTGPPTAEQNLAYGYEPNELNLEYPGQGVPPQQIASLQNLKPEMLTTTQPADPYGDAARVYAEEGELEDVQKVMSVQDILAKAKAMGDPVAYQKAKFSADNYDNFVKRITPLLKTAPGREQAESISKAYQAMHPEDATMYDISNWEVTAAGVANPVADKQGKIIGHMVTDSEGKTSFHKADKGAETWSEPYEANIGGKRAMVQKSSTGQVKPVIQDTSTTVKVSTGKGHTEFKDVMALRKEFTSLPEVKDYSMIQAQSLRAKKALEESLKNRSNMPVDQTVITTFNKLLDPTSVVRESEYARTPQDLAMLARIRGKWDKVTKGGAGLDLGERQALVRMIDNFREIADVQYNDQVEQYTEIANRNGFNPADVIRLGHKQSKPAQSAPVKVGGYTVKVKGAK